jgi:hypothetical protein
LQRVRVASGIASGVAKRLQSLLKRRLGIQHRVPAIGEAACPFEGGGGKAANDDRRPTRLNRFGVDVRLA